MRNDNVDIYAPCRCGSGKKYKFCCLQKDRQEKECHAAKTWGDPLRALEGRGRPTIVLDLEAGERLNREGMQLLSRQRFAKAEQSFRAAIAAAPLVPAVHNNLALVVFSQGRVEEAIFIQENILREVSIDNVFGMSNLVHFYLTAGRVSDAEAIARQTLRLKPLDAWGLVKKCEALARLGRHRDILNAVKRYVGECDGAVHYFAGMAAANLGLFDRALDCLRRVKRQEPLGPRAAKYAGLIEVGCGPDTVERNWPYFEPQDIMPQAVFESLVRESDKSGAAKARWTTNPVIVDMLAALLNQSLGKRKDEGFIDLLGHMDHPRAVDLLKRIAEGTFGNDDFRLSAVRTLVDKGVWDRGSAHKMWIRGKWIEVKTEQPAITEEAESAPMPDGFSPLYEAATIAVHCGRWEEGEKLWREFLSKAPKFHPAYHNLAVALIQQGRNTEAETHLRKAMELDPGYIFAPCTLASLCLQESRTAEARALLDKVIVPDKIHPAAMATYCSAQSQVAAAERDIETAVGWLDLAAKVDPGNRIVKELRKSLRLPRLAEKIFGKNRGKD